MGKNSMTKSDSSRIQSSQARSGGNMSSSGFAARAQSAGDRWAASQSYTSSSFSGFGKGTAGSGASANSQNGKK
ncbi:hypothetical protein VTK26DRAFT_1772 [Humicola hyalothermophila]